MPEYIEREAAIDAIIVDTSIVGKELKEIVNAICTIPAADVRPVVRASWQSWTQDKPPCKWYSCDYCGFHTLSKSHYCPNCGAMMEES